MQTTNRKIREQLVRRWLAEGLTVPEIVEALNLYEISLRNRPKAQGSSDLSDGTDQEGLR